MAGMQEMQEHFPARPWMAGMPEMQEHFSARQGSQRAAKQEQFVAR